MGLGLVIGGWFATTVIALLINKLIEYTKDHKEMLLGLKDELERLPKALPKIETVLKAVDQGLIREKNQDLDKWLWKLRDAADQAKDVMDEIKFNYEKERVQAEKNKVSKSITNIKTFFLCSPFQKRLKKAMKAIDEAASGVVEFHELVQGLVQNNGSAIGRGEASTALNFVGTDVFGREKEKDDIIKMLLNPNYKTEGKNFAVLSIIGVGGVGKTTLVQLVYNDPTVQKHFELMMWICISNNFDVNLLTKMLYEQAFGESPKFDSLDKLQTKLKDELQCKRFLVVFDNAWNDNDEQGWMNLVAPLKYGKSGSMILLTTRLKAVAKLIGPNVMDSSIILEGLNERSMWDLFKKCAFGCKDVPDNPKKLVKIGREIVKKLKGSPLAAMTVGGILCSNLNEAYWRRVLESELWKINHEEKEQNDLMASLRLTYQYLPPHLKPCFSFCSIFPQGHVFSKNDLINMWIALGIVRRSVDDAMKLEDVGSKYFDDMLSKSIFIRSNHVFTKNVIVIHDAYVMHDLIHDLCVLVSQGECLRTSTKKRVQVRNTVRHLYVHIDSHCELSLSHLKNLHTLILHFDESHHPNQDSLVNKMLKGMKSLRLLILFAHNLSEFPESASKLLLLRYLCFSSSRLGAFPKSVSRLYLLETIVCNDIETIQLTEADVLGNLINLRHLNTPRLLLDRVHGIGRLTSLQELSFSVGKDSGLKMLSDMRELQSLRINKMENVGSPEEVKQANLKDKVNLNELSLAWTPMKPNEPHLNDDVLDHLEPHPCLKLLTIRYFEGTGRPPNWFRAQALSKLVYLTIDGCNFDHLPCLEELSLLKYINFINMNAIKEIIHKCNLSSEVDVFTSLEQEGFLPSPLQKLSISSCGHLDNFLPKALESVDSLIELELRLCENITSLPPKEVFSRWKTLQRLTLEHYTVLASVESLLGLSCIKYLRVRGCPKLSPAIPSSLPLQTSNQNDEFNMWFSAYSTKALALFQGLMCILYLVLRMFMLKLKKSVPFQSQPLSPSSAMKPGKTSAQEIPLLSVDELVIDDPFLLSVEPIRSLSAVRKLTIEDCSKVQSLPKLPPFLQELHIEYCCPELRKRCEKSGPDWPKLSQVPKVIFKTDW